MGQYHPGMTLEGAGIVKGTGNVPPPPNSHPTQTPFIRGPPMGLAPRLAWSLWVTPFPVTRHIPSHSWAQDGTLWLQTPTQEWEKLLWELPGAAVPAAQACPERSRYPPLLPLWQGTRVGPMGLKTKGYKCPSWGFWGWLWLVQLLLVVSCVHGGEYLHGSHCLRAVLDPWEALACVCGGVIPCFPAHPLAGGWDDILLWHAPLL